MNGLNNVIIDNIAGKNHKENVFQFCQAAYWSPQPYIYFYFLLEGSMLCVKNYYSIWPSYRKDGMPFVTQCSSNQTRYIFRETYRYGGIIKRMKYEKTSQGSFSSVQAVD